MSVAGRVGGDRGPPSAVATMRNRAGVPEWPKGAGCKPAGSAFRGSNPLPCIVRQGVRLQPDSGVPLERRTPGVRLKPDTLARLLRGEGVVHEQLEVLRKVLALEEQPAVRDRTERSKPGSRSARAAARSEPPRSYVHAWLGALQGLSAPTALDDLMAPVPAHVHEPTQRRRHGDDQRPDPTSRPKPLHSAKWSSSTCS